MAARRGPPADSYLGAVALVICALVPFLMLTGAVFPLVPELSASLGLSKSTLTLAVGLADGAYAFGTVLAVQFAVHLPARRMLLGYVSLFLVAAVLAAWAPTGMVFVVAFIVEGLCTSLMLIAAAPALVTGWPVAKMPVTGFVMNLCVFGAVAVGPTIGGLQAADGQWRPLFWGVAGVAALALLFALLTFEDLPPQDDSAPWDIVAGAAGRRRLRSCLLRCLAAGERRAVPFVAHPPDRGGGDAGRADRPPVPRQAPAYAGQAARHHVSRLRHRDRGGGERVGDRADRAGAHGGGEEEHADGPRAAVPAGVRRRRPHRDAARRPEPGPRSGSAWRSRSPEWRAP